MDRDLVIVSTLFTNRTYQTYVNKVYQIIRKKTVVPELETFKPRKSSGLLSKRLTMSSISDELEDQELEKKTSSTEFSKNNDGEFIGVIASKKINMEKLFSQSETNSVFNNDDMKSQISSFDMDEEENSHFFMDPQQNGEFVKFKESPMKKFVEQL